MSDFQELLKDINEGRNGKARTISTGFSRLNKYVSLRKSMYFVVFGSTGCLSQGTEVIMFDGSLKKVEDVKINDLLMGPDSKPRRVLELKRGQQQMYWIRQNKGEDYRVNEDHILSLRKIRTLRKKVKGEYLKDKNQTTEIINISVKEALKKTKKFFRDYKGYKVGVDFNEKLIDIDPYFLGLWLGDGTSCKTEITTADSEIINYLKEFADKNDLLLNNYSYKSLSYNLVTKTRGIVGSNKVLNFLKQNNLLCNKHIPNNYIINSKENRLLLLAGLIDSDGYKDKNGGYSITLKNKELSNQIVYLARSLGYYTSINPKIAKMKRKDSSIYECEVFRITINGNNLYEIPCKIERKKITKKSTRLSCALSTGIRIEKDTVDNYYGFSLDGDNLFLLSDFTVTHNSGKSAFAHNTFILNPFDDYIKNNSQLGGLKLKIVLFTMERSKKYTQAKWLSRKIFLDQGILIQVPKLLGWWEDKLTNDEHDYVLAYEDYFNELEEVLDIHEGARSPEDVFRILSELAEKRGKFEKKDHAKIYTPNENKELVIVCYDHFGLTKMVKGNSKKESIDKVSEYFQYFRDTCGYSICGVSQINRDLSNPIYQKLDTFEPNIDNIKESGRPAEDADCVISLFDPVRYNTDDGSYGDVSRFRCNTSGAKFFRSTKILKNTYGEDDIRIGMAFHGATGTFKELPKPKYVNENWTDKDFNNIISGNYFLDI